MRTLMRLRRLAADRDGLAFLEFGMSLPVLVTLALVGIETANYAVAHMRVSQIALATADNASRVRDSIDENDVNDLMLGAKLAGGSIEFTEHGRIILSSLQENDAANGQWIRWQRCTGAKRVTSSYGVANAGRTDSSLQGMGPAGRQVSAASGSAVMFVEAVYDYQPIFSASLVPSGPIAYTAAYNVRKRPNADVTNTSSLTTANRARCNRYSA